MLVASYLFVVRQSFPFYSVSKIIPALQSRCTRFRFAPLSRPAMESRLRYVVEKEGLVGRVSDGAVRAILTLSGGDMRKVLNVLQASRTSRSGEPTPAAAC